MNRLKVNLIVILATVLIITLNSCSDKSIYDHNFEVADPWTADQIAAFNVEITDTISAFDFYINVRNTTEYNYSNLYLFIKTNFPDGRYAVDTVELFLADVKGNWLGSGFGEIKDNQILFRKRGRFPMSGIYNFTFEQAMRDKQLEGIKAVGIRIEKSANQ